MSLGEWHSTTSVEHAGLSSNTSVNEEILTTTDYCTSWCQDLVEYDDAMLFVFQKTEYTITNGKVCIATPISGEMWPNCVPGMYNYTLLCLKDRNRCPSNHELQLIIKCSMSLIYGSSQLKK